MKIGAPENRFDRIGTRLKRAVGIALFQAKMPKYRFMGPVHMAIFWGFLVLLIGTVLISIQENAGLDFLKGDFYLVFSLFMDVFGSLILVGVVVALVRRLLKPRPLDTGIEDIVVLAAVFLVILTGFLVEGFRLTTSAGSSEIERLCESTSQRNTTTPPKARL